MAKKFDLAEVKGALTDARDAGQEAAALLENARSTKSPVTVVESLRDAKKAMSTAKRAIAYALDCLPTNLSEREKTDGAERVGKQARIPGTGAAAE